MAGVRCLVLLFVGFVAVKAQYGVGNCGLVVQGTLIPNSNICGGYYVCNNGQLTSYQCPNNQAFSKQTQSCSTSSSCFLQIGNPYQPVWNYPSGGINGMPISVVPINGNPVNGYPINGYPINGYPINGNPIYGNPTYGYPNTVPTAVGSNSNPCSGMPSGSYAANPSSCNQFYYCNQGQAFSATCPSGYSFSLSQNSCVLSTLVC